MCTHIWSPAWHPALRKACLVIGLANSLSEGTLGYRALHSERGVPWHRELRRLWGFWQLLQLEPSPLRLHGLRLHGLWLHGLWLHGLLQGLWLPQLKPAPLLLYGLLHGLRHGSLHAL